MAFILAASMVDQVWGDDFKEEYKLANSAESKALLYGFASSVIARDGVPIALVKSDR